MTNILKRGINSNVLKTIALIAMVIDHFAYYFSPILPLAIYTAGRYIGRIAMPIFVYLLVQGFFHTRSFKKYIIRLGSFAVITQILITILMLVNIKVNPNYTAVKQVYTTGNILFTFVLSIIILKLLYEDIIIKKWDYNKNVSLKILAILVIVIASILIPIDYGIEVVILSVLFYYIEKFKIQVYLDKDKGNLSVNNVLLNAISDEKIKLIYLFLILFATLTLVIWFNAYWTILLAIIPIALYNNERGKIHFKYVYYVTFPLHHMILYLIAMLTLT